MNTEKLIRSALRSSIKETDLDVLIRRIQELVLRSSENEFIATQLVCGVPVEIDTENMQETYRDLLGYLKSRYGNQRPVRILSHDMNLTGVDFECECLKTRYLKAEDTGYIEDVKKNGLAAFSRIPYSSWESNAGEEFNTPVEFTQKVILSVCYEVLEEECSVKLKTV